METITFYEDFLYFSAIFIFALILLNNRHLHANGYREIHYYFIIERQYART